MFSAEKVSVPWTSTGNILVTGDVIYYLFSRIHAAAAKAISVFCEIATSTTFGTLSKSD